LQLVYSEKEPKNTFWSLYLLVCPLSASCLPDVLHVSHEMVLACSDCSVSHGKIIKNSLRGEDFVHGILIKLCILIKPMESRSKVRIYEGEKTTNCGFPLSEMVGKFATNSL